MDDKGFTLHLYRKKVANTKEGVDDNLTSGQLEKVSRGHF